MVSQEVAITPEMLDAEVCRSFWRGKFHPEGACCPDCRTCLTDQQTETWRDGGRVHCNGCGHWFTWRTATPLSRKGVDERQLFLITALSAYDFTAVQIANICGLSADTVRRWQQRLQEADSV